MLFTDSPWRIRPTTGKDIPGPKLSKTTSARAEDAKTISAMSEVTAKREVAVMRTFLSMVQRNLELAGHIWGHVQCRVAYVENIVVFAFVFGVAPPRNIDGMSRWLAKYG